RWSQGDTPLATVLGDAEAFATERLPRLLISGHAEASVLEEAASLVGIPAHLICQLGGRLPPSRFSRELLAHRGLVGGLYDASVTARDPFPHRERYRGPDPTLFGIERVFTAGINTHLRRTLQVDTERDYHLLSMAVNKAWKIDGERHALESQVGAADDLRYAMSLNPHMQVRISHGYYDLVTPYFSSNRLAGLMGLGGDAPTGRAESPVGAPAVYGNLSLKHYLGGHMFYTWDASRRAFRDDIRHFYSRAQSPTPGRGEGLP
ncbi:MAG: peptidase S10, partial [Candidatus Competibacterales bacterium]